MVITRQALVVSCLLTLLLGFGVGPRPALASLALREAGSPDAAKIRTAAKELSNWVTKQNGKLSLYVGPANSSEAIAAVNADQPLNPASNTKLLTIATALHELGSGFRFRTSLCGRIAADSIDTLGLVSNGDPTLDRPAMLDLAFQLVQQHVRQVKRIIVDQSAFDSNFTPPAFEQQPNEWSPFRAPVSAVAFNDNSVSVFISPTEPTKAVSVSAFPPSFLDLVVTARTRRAEEKAASLEVIPSSTNHRLKLRVTGGLQETAAPVTLFRRIDDPTTFAGYALADSLRALGVQLPSSIVIEPGKCEAAAEIAFRTSPALGTLVHQLGKDSDNFVAEMLVKAVGAHATGKPGTTADGLAVIREFSNKIHPLANGTRLQNGSGLFDANRISAEQLAAVLRFALENPQFGPEFVSSLAVAGSDGTLKKRLASAPFGAIRAKTGSLKQVTSLSGYLQPPSMANGFVFSVIINDVDAIETAKRKVDEFLLLVLNSTHE